MKIEGAYIILSALLISYISSANGMESSAKRLKSDAAIDKTQNLLDQIAEVAALDNNGSTTLIEAAKKSYDEACKLLIEKGANVHAQDSNGCTPLMWAAWAGLSEVCKLLIEKGANVHAKNNNGFTPLMWGANQDKKEVCKVILKGLLLNSITTGKKLSDTRKWVKTFLLCLNRRWPNFEKNLIPKIICSDGELETDLLHILLNAPERGRKKPEWYETIKEQRLYPLIIANLNEVKECMTAAKNKTSNAEILEILNTETIEHRIRKLIFKDDANESTREDTKGIE